MKKMSDMFLGCEKTFDEAKVVIFGAPFDSTVSYRAGSRDAAKTMRKESYSIETYSPYQDLDLEEDAFVCDGGDLELPFGDTELALKGIYDTAKEILEADKIPFMIGGEHLVTLPAVKAAWEKYPGLRLIQFDAHTDLREDYLGVKLSHATVMRRVWDFLGDGNIFQYGIRSGERAEFLWAKKHTRLTKFNFIGLEDAVAEISRQPVYLTIDLDVLDPSVLPGTGTPEAGGVTFRELLRAAETVTKNARVVGADITELAPAIDSSGASTSAALKLMREILLGLGGKK